MPPGEGASPEPTQKEPERVFRVQPSCALTKLSVTFALPLQRSLPMVSVALLVRLESKPGKEADVAKLLEAGLPLVQAEPATVAWFALRMGPTTFGIFDAFPNNAGRQAHLAGRLAAALMASASELLAKAPVIEQVDVLSAKLPA